MENRTPRLERAEEAVQAIVAAATSSLINEGIDSVTHRRVASLANANLRSTTYYFKSVKALRREAIKIAFGLADKQRETLLSKLSNYKKNDIVDLLITLTYGENLSIERLAVTQKNVLTASVDPDYSDLLQDLQTNTEKYVEKLLAHFEIKLDPKRAIAAIDGRIFEYVMSGGKTDFKKDVHGDLGL